MKESDWKIFKKIKENALDKFCRNALSTFEENIHDKDQSPHQRYLTLFENVDTTNRQMALLFDDHSRSKAWQQMLAIRGEGLVDEQLVSELSEEFRQLTDPEKFNR